MSRVKWEDVNGLGDIDYIIDVIKNNQDDDEVAHSIEDDLREWFIEYVRDNSSDIYLSDAAALVLSTNNIEFARWCA